MRYQRRWSYLCTMCGVLATSSLGRTEPGQTWVSWPGLPARPPGVGPVDPFSGPVAAPELEASLNDPLVEVTDDSRFRGTLAYVPGGAFTLRSIGLTRLIGNQASAIANYLASDAYAIYDPQLSPQGHYLIYKVGVTDAPQASYRPVIWDFRAQRLHIVNFLGSDGVFDWAPNERYFAMGCGIYDPVANRRLFVGQDVAPYEAHHEAAFLAARLDVAWTSHTTLLLVGLPPVRPQGGVGQVQQSRSTAATQALARPSGRPNMRPNIYEASPLGGRSKLLIKEACAPVPSPDDRWIGCFGWPEPAPPPGKRGSAHAAIRSNHAQDIDAAPTGIYLFNRMRRQRIFLRALPRIHSGQQPPRLYLRWTPDSRHLLLIAVEAPQPPVEPTTGDNPVAPRSTAHVAVWNIPHSESTTAPLLTTKPVGDFSAPGVTPRQVSNDGKFLFFQTSEPRQGAVRRIGVIETMWAMTLSDGKCVMLARFDVSQGR